MSPSNPLPRSPSPLASAWRRLRGQSEPFAGSDTLPRLAVAARCVHTLGSPTDYRETLLARIRQARRRILIATLYLQDDDAGREVLEALYAAKAGNPALEIAVFVDWHRAQRGLIGKTKSAGNAAMYKEFARRHGPGVSIYGVPVQRRELMGVLHLKGFVIDDAVLYSGASLNDVYLHKHERYRLDRYHLIEHAALADSFAAFLNGALRDNPAVHLLNGGAVPKTASLRGAIVKFRRMLATSHYNFAPAVPGKDEVGITPLLGLGARSNTLNATLVDLVKRAQQRLILFTPYFNLPGPIRRALDKRIREGVKVIIIVGDKTANDFFIPVDEPFKAIGALPYLYEGNLRRFCKTHQKAIDKGVLDVHLWRHESNSYHLKGMLIDEEWAMLTGNNLNPRAWRLDLENGLLIHDPQKLLIAQHMAEFENLIRHTTRIVRHDALDTVDSYPAPVQRLLKRLGRTRADRLLNQVL